MIRSTVAHVDLAALQRLDDKIRLIEGRGNDGDQGGVFHECRSWRRGPV